MNIDAVQFLEDIVTIRSHSGEEQDVTRFIVGRMAEWGYIDPHVDEAGNAVGTRENPDEHGKITTEIVLLGHIDTVPGVVPVRIEDGKLYGRGSVDAKGPFAAFTVAGAQANLTPGTRIVVIGATEEEAASSKGAHYVRDHYQPDFCIIGEPSGWDGVTLGYKGVILFDYRLDQEMGHTAGPEVGVAEQAVEFWNRMIDYVKDFNQDKSKLFDQILPSLRNFNTQTDGITDSAVMRLGFRLPPDFDIGPLVELAETSKGSAEVEQGSHTLAWHSKRTNPLAKAFSRAILQHAEKPRPKLKTGTSDMNVVGPKWQCPIIAYGAGDSTLDHTPHEHVVITEYLKAVSVLKSVLENRI
ncbi:MAG: LysW-gamma-L-lysine carboxypeptidase [Cellvibrionaceae bacterium]|jgi:LysW-gamma-L-lysine carboxypeptidase